MQTYPKDRSKRTGNGKPVFVEGVRSPFVKSFGVFEQSDTLELFSCVTDGLIRKMGLSPEELDEIVAGVVIPQVKNANVARDTILNLGLPHHVHGYTLNRACTSSLHAIAEAAKTIKFGHQEMILAGGVECLSDVPIVYSKGARQFLVKMSKAKSTAAKIDALKYFSAKEWLPKPPALTEPMTGLTMGEHAEIMAKLNTISREEQDAFACRSHQLASEAFQKGKFDDEVLTIWPSPDHTKCVDKDNIIRDDCSLDALAKLKPVFDRKYGSLTAANSSPLTDGASVSLITDEKLALELNLSPKSRILDFCFVGIDPREQLLIGPAVAIPKLLKRNGLTTEDIDLWEIHEAFAAQVLSCLKSIESAEFNNKYFGDRKPFGKIPLDRLNVNGGAIAIGHPFGATGSRLLTTLSNELIRQDKNLGVIGICAAGGMAGAMIIEKIPS